MLGAHFDIVGHVGGRGKGAIPKPSCEAPARFSTQQCFHTYRRDHRWVATKVTSLSAYAEEIACDGSRIATVFM